MDGHQITNRSCNIKTDLQIVINSCLDELAFSINEVDHTPLLLHSRGSSLIIRIPSKVSSANFKSYVGSCLLKVVACMKALQCLAALPYSNNILCLKRIAKYSCCQLVNEYRVPKRPPEKDSELHCDVVLQFSYRRAHEEV